MNKINLVIDMRTDSLRFLNTTSSLKLTVSSSSLKAIAKQKSLTPTHILKRKINQINYS